jgi:hypothetical protein
MSSAMPKIRVLEKLKVELLDHQNLRKDLKKVINDWAAKIFKEVCEETMIPTSTLIALHRNIFLPKSRSKYTNTLTFINNLTDVFGNIILTGNSKSPMQLITHKNI